MHAADIMTRRVVTIGPDNTVAEAAALMLRRRISGLPVVDSAGVVVGIVTEGDLLHRVEAGTDPRRPKWLSLLMSPGKLAAEYAHVHGRKIGEVMRRDVITTSASASLSEVVGTMEKHAVKRLPVVREGRLIGMISRADLLKVIPRLP